ncbi:hypothetical protein BLSMQ_3352 [Brevibacterium aurantiacum]|uniref:HTH cro/C1-type domain-containing protein n=1 Tax=Brevibacterium aurantiacum TaxID=273384 RepID=A0A1D7W7U3_BREAU|nr:hypothetical protein BLSMQ_3352 [Brevibacterium aurantiacum]
MIREVDESFTRHLKARRTYLRFSQAIIARMMKYVYGFDWHQTVLAKIENRDRSIKLTEAYALARLYEIPLQDLIDGIDLDRPASLRAGTITMRPYPTEDQQPVSNGDD